MHPCVALQTGLRAQLPAGSPAEGFAPWCWEWGEVAAHTAVLNTRSSDGVNTHLELFIAIIKWEFS